MANKVTLKNVSNLSATEMETALNENFTKLGDAIDDTLSRTGKTPNQMESTLDMNGHVIANVGDPISDADAVNKRYVDSWVPDMEYRGTWAANVDYSKNNVVTYNGSSYICVSSHKSTISDTPDTSSNWALLAEKGDKGDSGNAFNGVATVTTDTTIGEGAYAGYLVNVDTSSSDITLFIDDSSTGTWFFVVHKTSGDTNFLHLKRLSDGTLIDTVDSAIVIVSTSGINVLPLDSHNTIRVFDPLDYIDKSQHKYIANNDVSSQNATLVTAGIQAAMDAAMDWYLAGTTDERTVIIKFVGTFAVNDELFSETFAENLWNMSGTTTSGKWLFDFKYARFKLKGFVGATAVRNSGFYKQNGITDPVPKALFRWEQKLKYGFSPIIQGGEFEGEEALTDPICFKFRSVNHMFLERPRIMKFLNTGLWIEQINNSDFISPLIFDCGYQPTNIDGSGFVSSTARVTTTAGSTTVTCNEAVFDASHVGKFITIGGAGAQGTALSARIASVVSATEITLDTAASLSVTDTVFSFGILTGSITAGTNNLTLDANLTDSLVGRYVMVYGAGSNIQDGEGVLVTRVTAHSGTSVTLASTARFTVTNTPVIVAPARFIGKSDDIVDASGVAEAGHNNDYQDYGSSIETGWRASTGSAILSVEQYGLSNQDFGSKFHGAAPDLYNNFASNAMCVVYDQCKYIQRDSTQYEWGDWSDTHGKIVFTGDQMVAFLDSIQIGPHTAMDKTADFYIDPISYGSENKRVVVSGYSNRYGVVNDLSTKVLLRNGPKASNEILVAGGPLVYRDRSGYPGMPRSVGSKLELYDISPYVIFRDTNSSTRGRWLFNSTEIKFALDDNNDGIFDAGGFGWNQTLGLFIDRGAGNEGLFEEGTWTPVLYLGGVDITTAGGALTATGTYIRILNLVYVIATFTLTAKGTATGTLSFSLPFSSGVDQAYLGVAKFSGFASLTHEPSFRVYNNTALGQMLGSGGGGYVNITDVNLTDTTTFTVSGAFPLI